MFEDSESKPTDPWLTRATQPVWTFGDEVLHVARSNNAADIDAVINQAESSWLLIGVVSELAAGPADRRSLEREDVSGLAQRTVAVVVSAFDGESYVIGVNPTQRSDQ